MTVRNIVIIVVIFIFAVVISAFFYAARQNAIAQNGMASISQATAMQTLPPPSTVPPQQYITVPTAYYINSTPQNTAPARPTTVRNTPTNAGTVPAARTTAPVDVNYWEYRFDGVRYVPYYPYTPDHRAPGSV